MPSEVFRSLQIFSLEVFFSFWRSLLVFWRSLLVLNFSLSVSHHSLTLKKSFVHPLIFIFFSLSTLFENTSSVLVLFTPCEWRVEGLGITQGVRIRDITTKSLSQSTFSPNSAAKNTDCDRIFKLPLKIFITRFLNSSGNCSLSGLREQSSSKFVLETTRNRWSRPWVPLRH